MALKEMFMVMKKREPWTFWTPGASVPVLKKSRMANSAVRQVVKTFTYEVWGSLRRLRKFLLQRRPNW